jgi:transketolase
MEKLNAEKVALLKNVACDIRKDVVHMLAAAGSGHTAGSLDMVDVFTALYFHVAKLDPKNPLGEERDRIVLSHGHTCPAQYATMAHAGFFPREELLTLRKFRSRLQGHPQRQMLPGIETTSGPLGCGLAQAVGMAITAKMDKKAWRVYCCASDAEQQEGNTWEAVMLAAKMHLDNLVLFIDRNSIQIEGSTETVMPLESLGAKYTAFNWHVMEIDGNDMEAIAGAYEAAQTVSGKPVCIVARTIPGKGVSSIEGDYKWHGMTPTAKQAEEFAAQIR